MFSRSHSPPPSHTARMWSASQRLLRPRNCHTKRAFAFAGPRRRRMRAYSAMQSRPQTPQTPRSLSNTRSRRWPGLLRSFHSSTHHSEQNVRRPGGTSRLHHRQRHRPFTPLDSRSRSARPPRILRSVLTKTAYSEDVLWQISPTVPGKPSGGR